MNFRTVHVEDDHHNKVRATWSVGDPNYSEPIRVPLTPEGLIAHLKALQVLIEKNHATSTIEVRVKINGQLVIYEMEKKK